MVGSFTDNAIILLFIFSVPATLVILLVGWTRWKEESPVVPGQSQWRRSAAVVELTLASISAIAFGGTIVAPQFAGTIWLEGSYRLATTSGVGGACALLGVSLSIAGSGKCRIPGFIGSLLQVFWWYAIYEAMRTQ